MWITQSTIGSLRFAKAEKQLSPRLLAISCPTPWFQSNSVMDPQDRDKNTQKRVNDAKNFWAQANGPEPAAATKKPSQPAKVSAAQPKKSTSRDPSPQRKNTVYF